ncbi:hypothetical protein [Clostridium botulinum]|uniref:Uncharacterized protein n=1 Tax=Clostridium botulinum (strain Langeland / NCTC 10281 / Type F) TaxID=441772 RepID=A7GI57_CLOBL|nr:hypothetical protein [Clostridium botulinum]ABS41432.1 hypothetical protein CLI_3255 [Clostridium botulinum F str. Langeland]ADG00831.1 hypothetical protein CBF_3245 [Clostridium botulinum F str. 230613]KKM40663.1 hypothetical protein VT72_11280 [Clostridium botulinum]MBY6794362.1 hypothetical protein [Clostridium botulinum]MBY6938150.1 hypothetical protein [Clostridium botulinum]
MQYLKIINLIDNNGICQYKGLDVNKFFAGSQMVNFEENTCVIKTMEEEIPKNSDLTVLSEDDYISEFKNIENKRLSEKPKSEEEISQEKQQALNAKLLKDNAEIQIELNKQKELNADLLLKIAQLGGNANA